MHQIADAARRQGLTRNGGIRTIRAMQFDTWDYVFNLAFAILWFRIFNPVPEGDFWNPYTAPLRKFTDSIIGLLKPAFPRLPATLVALFLLVIVLVSRALLCPRTPAVWKLQLGLLAGYAQTDTLAGCFAGSCVSAAIFMLHIWMIALFYLPSGRSDSSDRTRNALFVLAKPFSLLPHSLQPLVLILGGMGLVFAVERILPALGLMATSALVAANPLTATPVIHVLRPLLLGLSVSVNAIYLLQQMVIFLIIGSWGGAFLGLPGLSFFCREWTDLLMGPLRRHPIRVGPIDLTALVFMVLLFFVQMGISITLYQALRSLT